MKLPDGPRTPRFLQLLQWIARPLEYLETSAQRYGDCFTARWGNLPPYVLLSNPQAIKEIFTTDPMQFDSGPSNRIAKPLLGEHSLMLMDGERHRRERQLLTPPIFRTAIFPL